MTIPDAADPLAAPAPSQHRAAVMGFPASHSLSPTIHRRGYDLCGLTGWRYDIVELRPAEVEAYLDSRDASWRGFSVTMPLKETAARLGEPDPLVEATGVANTIVIDLTDGVRRVYNTDIAGFTAAMTAAQVAPPRAAIVIGSGATALSAMVALGSLGTPVTITARNRAKADRLAARGAELGIATDVCSWGTFPHSDAIISTVPSHALIGHLPAVTQARPRFVFDVIYHPWPTPLAEAGRSVGATVISGLDLLVHQAVEQFLLFTGHRVAPGPLLLAVRAEAARRAAT